jgi:hypothetical protein
VAPLTTTVINAVPAHRSGVASGVNNAVASVARLLAVAIFGAVALHVFDRALDQRLASEPMASEVRQAVAAARGKFVVEPTMTVAREDNRRAAESILRDARARSIRMVMALAAALALAGAACTAVLIR